MNTKEIYSRLWNDYTFHNPYVRRIFDLFVLEGEQVLNDHIAFRTFDDIRVNVDVLSRIFLKAGYSEKGQYHFEQKHLFAKHFEMDADKTAPRVFISQLLTSEFSPFLRFTVKKLIDEIPEEVLQSDELLFLGKILEKPRFEVYEKLRQESEYASWMYVNGFMANHFTVSVNHLRKFDTLQKVNDFLKKKGYDINNAGGEIQGSPAELLEQSSVKASLTPIDFSEGTFDTTSSYYEFAKRYPDIDGKLFSDSLQNLQTKYFKVLICTEEKNNLIKSLFKFYI